MKTLILYFILAFIGSQWRSISNGVILSLRPVFVVFFHINFYLQIETFDEDVEFLLSGTELKQMWEEKKKNQSKDSERNFMCELTKEQYTKIVDMYRLDYELFDYQIDDYDSICSN